MFEFNENNEVTDKHVYRAILVGVSFGEDITASMEELEGLAEAADVEILGQMLQAREETGYGDIYRKGQGRRACRNMQQYGCKYCHIQ